MKTRKNVRINGLLILFILLSVAGFAQNWFPTGSNPDKYEMGGNPTVEHGSENPAYIHSKEDTINGFGTWATNIDAKPYLGKAISLTAYVQSTEVENWAGLWMRVDGDSKGSLTFDNMRSRSIQGTTDWKMYRVTLDVPTKSSRILFGLLLSGTGSVLFDGVTISEATRTWTPQDIPEDTYTFCVDAADDQVVWAGGFQGGFLRTTDGGENWTSGKIPGTDSLIINSIVGIDALTAYATAQFFDTSRFDARIYKTMDGGENWELQYHNREKWAFFNSIAFWDAQNGIALSDPVQGTFLVLTTSDGGDTWNQVPTEALPPLLDGEFPGFGDAGGKVLALAGDQDVWFGTGYLFPSNNNNPLRVFHSRDRGQSWSVSNTPLMSSGNALSINTIDFSDTLFGFAGSYLESELLVTSDGGETWSLVDSFPEINPANIAFVPGSGEEILITSFQGSAISKDSGLTWELLSTEPHAGLTLVNESIGWASSGRGGISKYSPGMNLSTAAHAVAEHEGYAFYPPSPNPVRFVSFLEFTVPRVHRVQIEILDAQGRRIGVLVNNSYASGTHRVPVDLTGKPAGVYIARLKAGPFRKSQKVIYVP